MALKLLGLVGSLRAGSLNRALLQAVADAMPSPHVLELYPTIGDLPLFDSDVVEEAPAVTALKTAITAADGLVIATPEYNYSVPGVLKNAIDWASRGKPAPLRGKPVILLGCSPGISGSMRAQYHLRQIFVYFDAPVMSQPELILPRAHEQIVDGKVVNDSTRAFVATFAQAAATFVSRARASA